MGINCWMKWVRKGKRKKGSVRPGSPHHLEAIAVLRPETGVGRKSHGPPGSLCSLVKSQARPFSLGPYRLTRWSLDDGLGQ